MLLDCIYAGYGIDSYILFTGPDAGHTRMANRYVLMAALQQPVLLDRLYESARSAARASFVGLKLISPPV